MQMTKNQRDLSNYAIRLLSFLSFNAPKEPTKTDISAITLHNSEKLMAMLLKVK